jgi:dihydrodipicolinate synthase/N-acetylneuraminate lyase
MMDNQSRKKHNGVIVPMITPLNADYSIDSFSVSLLMKTFTNTDCSVFVLGTTGESTSIAEKDKTLLVKTAIEKADHMVSVYAGISGNCLEDSIANARLYSSLGTDAVVAHLPFYFPMQESHMIRYFEKLADSIPCPLILYNNPITVKESIPVEVIEKLSYHPNIAGIKDSERGMERLDQSLQRWSSREDFSYLLGWTAKSAYALGKGCDGIVPSTANLNPQLYHDLYAEAVAGHGERAEELQQMSNRITDIYIKGRIISESIPVLKVIMAEYGLCKTTVLPPLYEPDLSDQQKLRKEIRIILQELSIQMHASRS